MCRMKLCVHSVEWITVVGMRQAIRRVRAGVTTCSFRKRFLSTFLLLKCAFVRFA